MVEVYYYVPRNSIKNAVECGLKLSQWYEKEVWIEGENKKCLCALLNPKDDMEKYKSIGYDCVKLELYPEYCMIADRSLYKLGLKHEAVMKRYIASVMPVKEYTFGLYRLPECLVTSTIIPEQISLLDKRLDSPILFDSSEELYINNVIEDFKQEYDNLNDRLLFCFLKERALAGELELLEADASDFVGFADRKSGKVFTVRRFI